MQSFRGSWLYTASQFVVICCCFCALTAHAQEGTAPAVKPVWLTADTDALNRINATEAKLNQRVTFDFSGVPLSEALPVLGQQVGTTFHLNLVEFDTLGVSPDTPVTQSNRSVTLEEALSQILQSYDLSFIAHESDIEISSTDDLNRTPVIRVYDLSQAFHGPVDLTEVIFKISQFVDPYEWRDFGGTGDSVMMPFGSSMVVAAPLTTHRGVVRVLRTVADTPSFLKARDDSWKPRKALQFSFNNFLFNSMNSLNSDNKKPIVGDGTQKLEPGSVVLPKGTTYDLVRITQQPAESSPAKAAVGWMKRDAAAPPAWLTSDLSDFDVSEPLRQKLRQTIDVDFKGVPLNVALADIFKRLEIPHWINDAELDTIGVTVDAPITFKLGNTSAQHVLRRMLGPLDMTFRIGGNSIEVTSNDDANKKPTSRFYDLSVLRSEPFDMQALLMTVSQVVAPDEWRDFGGTGDSTLITFGSKLTVTASDAAIADFEMLLCQLALMHPDNLPQPKPQLHIKVDTVLTGIPGGSTVKIPTDGVYQIRPN